MNQLDEKGYLSLPPLSSDKCDSIVEQLAKLEYKARHRDHVIVGFDYDKAQHGVYFVTNQTDVINIPEVRELSNDPTILDVVEEFLGYTPILTMADSWWSVNISKEESRRCGEAFHQDNAFNKFVKLFLYLSDVGMENGPHAYVVGSANNTITPSPYHVSVRVSDDFINANYSNIKYFTGDKGTMNLVVTRGYHKGTPVENGHRLMLQFQWVNKITTPEQAELKFV